VAKRISLVVTYDTETEKSVVDLDASSILFPEGPCWDDEMNRWVEEPVLVDDVKRRLDAHIRTAELSAPSSRMGTVPIETKFIELALNIIDPDGAWDPEETLGFGDAARVYLSEYPITNWEIEGAFALVAQFVHDWALGEAQGRDALASSRHDFVASLPTLQNRLVTVTAATGDVEDTDLEPLTSIETEDPMSGMTLRMVFGDYEGLPTLALFVGEDEEPILIDRSALQIAVEQGWEYRNDANEPVLTFRANAELELEVIDLDINTGPVFE